MIVVSGCPRSGTSLTMDCMRHAFGEDRIMGKKFPQERKYVFMKEKQEDESDNQYQARMYLRDELGVDDKEFELIKDMNPNGFWECQHTVRGINWHVGFENDPKTIVKVVSQGLFRTDPQYIDKIIYLLREPHQVAKSQERLRRMPFMDIEEERKMGIHTPEMFIQVTYQAAVWLKHNPDVPILFINFDDLIVDPDSQFARITEFLGEGDFTGHPVEPKLKRSDVEHKDHALWEEAETIYELMCVQDYDGIIEFYKERQKKIMKDKIQTLCVRLKETMVYNECLNCLNGHTTRTNFRKRADNKLIDWWNKPCIFKCMTEQDIEHDSIEDSIKHNHWLDTTEKSVDELQVDLNDRKNEANIEVEKDGSE